MRREPLRYEHLDRFEMRLHEQRNMPTINLELVVNNAVADALIDKDGDVMAIIGFFVLWKGVAEVFAIPSRYVSDCGFRYVRHVRRELDRIMIENDLRRVQTTSLNDDQTNKWMELLGFVKEGTMKEYTEEKHDYNVWARFR